MFATPSKNGHDSVDRIIVIIKDVVVIGEWKEGRLDRGEKRTMPEEMGNWWRRGTTLAMLKYKARSERDDRTNGIGIVADHAVEVGR